MNVAAVFALSAALFSPQLSVAEFDIEFTGEHAVVEASYVLAATADTVRYVLIVVDGQTVRMLDRVVSLVETPGLYELRATRDTLRLRYEVAGSVSRIPLFVPDVPTDPVTSRVEIRAHGLREGTALSDGFPRFRATGERGAVATPENVPSFVLLPERSGLSVNRLADAFVVVLVTLASLLWLRRRMRTPAAARGQRS